MNAQRFRVSYAPRVAIQMERALAWWRSHRPAAPHLLLHEIEAALDLVSLTPQAACRVAFSGANNVRRLFLPLTRYHLYFQLEREDVRLVAFRHARRRPLLRSR